MPPDETEAILKQELQIKTLSSVFEWIDLDEPLGSASIAQVHKAKLKRYVPRPSTLRRVLGAPVQWWRAVSRTLSHSSGVASDHADRLELIFHRILVQADLAAPVLRSSFQCTLCSLKTLYGA